MFNAFYDVDINIEFVFFTFLYQYGTLMVSLKQIW